MRTLLRHQLKHTLLVFCTAALFTGCGQKHDAEQLIGDFLDTNLKDNAISGKQFSDLDSTFYVSDSMINVMHDNAARSSIYKGNVKYVSRRSQKLLFMDVSYSDTSGKRTKQTFYLDENMAGVVGVKQTAEHE